MVLHWDMMDAASFLVALDNHIKDPRCQSLATLIDRNVARLPKSGLKDLLQVASPLEKVVWKLLNCKRRP